MGVLTLPEAQLEWDSPQPPPELDCGPYASVAPGDIGGLTQFGVRIETLPPGSASSLRHWHSAEDEFVLVLHGTPTLVEDSGETPLVPGNAAAFPAGRANGHCLQNRSDADVRLLVAGWRDPADICRYSGLDRQAGPAGLTRRDGTPIGKNDLPGPYADPPTEGPSGLIDQGAAPLKTGSIYPAPYDAQMAGRSSTRLGQAGGLTQFGANIVILTPGATSSLRHWHTHEDEFVMVTAGAVTLIQDAGPTVMGVGECAAFPAGDPDGHHFLNHTGAEARFLVLGTRAAHEIATYSDVDLNVEMRGGTATFTHRDGRPYQPPKPGDTT